MHLHIERLFFPVGGDAEHQRGELEPQIQRRQNHILPVRLLWQHKQHQGVREVVRKGQIAADPGPEKKFTVRQAVRLVKEVPQQNKDSNVKDKANDDEAMHVGFESARLATDISVSSRHRM